MDLQAAPYDFDILNDDLGFLKDDYGNMNDDFGYASSENDYYPLDITQGLDFFTISMINIIYVKSYD